MSNQLEMNHTLKNKRNGAHIEKKCISKKGLLEERGGIVGD
jgi:hypothetical protein